MQLPSVGATDNEAWQNPDVPSRSGRLTTLWMRRGSWPFSAAAIPCGSRRHAGTTHVARQALWSFWQLPRLPRPLVQGKYPVIYPWSVATRAAYAANPKAPKGGRGLILEHLRPRNILIGLMIEESEQLTAGDLIRYLSRFLAGAVITKDEDLLLTTPASAMSRST